MVTLSAVSLFWNDKSWVYLYLFYYLWMRSLFMGYAEQQIFYIRMKN